MAVAEVALMHPTSSSAQMLTVGLLHLNVDPRIFTNTHIPNSVPCSHFFISITAYLDDIQTTHEHQTVMQQRHNNHSTRCSQR